MSIVSLVVVVVVTTAAIVSEKGHKILDTKLHILQFVACQSCRRKSPLFFLELWEQKKSANLFATDESCTDIKDTLLHGIWYGKFMDIDIAGLTQTVSTVECLIFQRRVPPEIHKNNVVAARKVEA